MNVELHDEGSNVNKRQRNDLVIARSEDEDHASESSSSESSTPPDTTSEHHNMGGSTSGGGSRNEGESEEQVQQCALFPGGSSDGSLMKSFKDHVALAIWNNETSKFLLNKVLTKLWFSYN
ncbi:hypothetical protein Syun_031270 [Stephania yunnanensis]|uniref:Uncharacterized protein n=1 Tax=Stephania yunnanensis TaxID=152371 RepID=A0AAP0DWK3_9MAGN